MKNTLIGICLILTAGSAAAADHRYHQETRTAEQLVSTLERLVYEARNEENLARRNGNQALLRDLADIRDNANILRNGVETGILWVLHGRSNQRDLAYAKRELNNLRWQFERLYRTAQTSRYLPWTLTRLVDEVRYLHGQLSQELNSCRDGGIGPIPYPRPNENWECSAKDAGWEEHAGGHKGWGYDRRSAEFDAVDKCQRLHGQCYVTSCKQVR